MSPQLSWFTVRLSVEGISDEEAAIEVQALQDELNMRPHLKNPQAHWETKAHRAIIQVDTEGLKAESAAEQMAEELLEIASAVLLTTEPIHVEIMEARSDPD